MNYSTLLKQYLREVEEEGAVFVSDPTLFFAERNPPPKPSRAQLPLPKKLAPPPPPVEGEIEERLLPKPSAPVQENKTILEDDFSDIRKHMNKKFPSYKILPLPKFSSLEKNGYFLFIYKEQDGNDPFWEKLIHAVEEHIAPVKRKEWDPKVTETLEKDPSLCCIIATPGLKEHFRSEKSTIQYLKGVPVATLFPPSRYEEEPALKRKLWNFLKTFGL